MKNIITVFKYTFIEVARSKVMIIIPIISVAIFFISYLSSTFAYGAPARVAVDIGLGLMSLANITVAIFLGATLISKEIESKTIYMIISKPISRAHFLIGKSLGLMSVIFINGIVQTLTCVVIYHFFQGNVSSLIYFVGLFSMFESLIIMLFAIMYSLISNTSLAVIFTIVTWVISHVIIETQKILFLKNNALLSSVLNISSKFLPDFSRFNVKDFVLYEQSLPSSFLLMTILYFFIYTAILLILTNLIFKKKDLN